MPKAPPKAQPNKRRTHADQSAKYQTQRWRKLSKHFRKSNPLCVVCLEKGISKPAQNVDHIQPVEHGGDMYDWDNLQSLCISCHNRKRKGES